jgi:Ala-tRNA(Pro) deacylase
MPVRPAIREWLEHVHVPYTALAHEQAFTAQEEAAVAKVAGRDWAKTVVCFADEEPILAVLPAPLHVKVDKLRALVGARRVRLATEEEMGRLYPDCEVGATPPLGPLYKQRVFLDQRLAKEAEIVFSAGTHTDAIRMSYAAFAEIAHPLVGDFGELEEGGNAGGESGRGLWAQE